MKFSMHLWNLLLFILPLASAKRGFILTSSSALFSKNTETLYLTLYDVPDPGSFQVSLTSTDGKFTYVQFVQNVKSPSPKSGQLYKVDLFVPKQASNGPVNLLVKGTFGNYVFQQQNAVKVYSLVDTTFIETDKPIYKPGQLVQFRVLPVDSKLKPMGRNAVADAWIVNPKGIRIAQWLGRTFENGMSQYEMQLSDYPEFGEWTVHVNLTVKATIPYGSMTEQKFYVQEYVLPKFQVEITAPPYVLSSADSFLLKICGRYTYGQPVNGNLTIMITTKEDDSQDGLNYATVKHDQTISGCVDYAVSRNDFGWQTGSSRRLKIVAKISEDGTDVEQNSTTFLQLSSKEVILSFVSPSQDNLFFKPGIPVFGVLTVTNPDNTPRSGEQIHICVSELSSCNDYTSDTNGNVYYTIPTVNNDNKTLQITANAVRFPAESVFQQLRAWYSPSKHYIQILPSRNTISCDTTQQFTMYFNGQDGDNIIIYYQIMSRDGIASGGSTTVAYSSVKNVVAPDSTYINKNSGATTFGVVSVSVDIKNEMSPKGFLLVYYTTADGEIIADSTDFDITECLKNKVKLDFLSTRELPGATVGLRITASPKSVCGLGVVDKSVYLLNTSSALTMDKVFNVLNKYGENRYSQANVQDSCDSKNIAAVPSENDLTSKRSRLGWNPNYSIYADSSNAFKDGKFLVLTDLTLVTKPCTPIRIYYPVFADGGGPELERVVELEAAGDGGPLAQNRGINENAAQAISPTSPDANADTPTSVVEVRTYFPETWLWEMDIINDNGEYTTEKQLPHTITEWVGSAVCLNSVTGLGVSPPASITTFQPFFLSTTLPYSVIRGESFTLIVKVFNYLPDCLSITVTIDQNENFTVVSEQNDQTFCVCGQESFTYKLLIKPETLGQLNITSRASSTTNQNVCGTKTVSKISANDAATSSVLVEAEGFKQQKAFSRFFCPSDTGGVFQVTNQLELPEDSIKDSVRAEFLVSGDLMGPVMNNLENLIYMPTGCGEQTMIGFVPDICVLDYLTSTNQLTPETEQKLLQYLTTGYQRELTFRHDDKSYSAFGNSDPVGSLWLSAFVVKAFHGAKKYIYVDDADISVTIDWLLENQQSNGCFPEIGQIFHTGMKGGEGSNMGSEATLTAYTLISLLEAGFSKTDASIQNALSCMNEETNPSTYTLALMAYASCLAGEPNAAQLLQKLMDKKLTSGSDVYWTDDDTMSTAIQIEITSYAILASLSCSGENGLMDALPAVRWIVSHRNTNGGFYSTQDTVMALQALATYATMTHDGNTDINIVMQSNGLQEMVFQIDKTNNLLLQTVALPVVPTTVSVKATGKGCALIQTNLFYNIRTPPSLRSFQLDTTTKRGVGGNCNTYITTFCMSFNNQKRDSNMAVIEMRLPSGFDVDKNSIEALRSNKNLYFKKFEVDENQLVLYFEKVVAAKTCFDIIFDQTMEVTNLQPTTARLFDYYEPENQISTQVIMNINCEA